RNRGFRSVGFIALIILIGLIIFAAYNQPSGLQEVSFSEVINQANKGEIQRIEITGDSLEVTPKGESEPTLQSQKEPGSSIYEQGLTNREVIVDVNPESQTGDVWLTVGANLLPVILIGLILFFMLRSAQGQGNQALSFGKSRARLYGNEKNEVVFKDIAGNDEAKQDLQEVVEFLKFPKKFEAVGAK